MQGVAAYLPLKAYHTHSCLVESLHQRIVMSPPATYYGRYSIRRTLHKTIICPHSNQTRLCKLTCKTERNIFFKGVLHPWTLFLKTLCIFPKNKATSDKVFYGSGQKCSKELKNHTFTSVETIVVKLQ